jgi:hypothetical protein
MKDHSQITADHAAWIEQTFDNPGVRNGGIFRTSVKAVETGIGMDRFVAEVQRRRFRALENRGHIVVFCNMEPVAILNDKAVPSATTH